MFMIDLLADAGEGRAGFVFCFESETHADDFEGVGEEDG